MMAGGMMPMMGHMSKKDKKKMKKAMKKHKH